jgi:hypothetical protein
MSLGKDHCLIDKFVHFIKENLYSIELSLNLIIFGLLLIVFIKK